jgi:3-hydroxyisobutyrate dehydrogenase
LSKEKAMTESKIEKDPMPQVAVIGTGTMGAAMGRRLLGAGMDVHIWSRHPASTMPLVGAGATAFETAPDAAKDADVVITMLPTAEVTAQVMFDGQALEAMKPGSVWVQMATIGVDATERMAESARTLHPDIAYIDAPVSGSREPAENGQLLILASGPRAVARSVEPVFGVLGRGTLWLGAAGAGSALKLVLNTWLAFQAEGAAEAAALAERMGVPSSALFDALRDNPLASPYALGKLARMVEQDYHADFSLDWALKDLDLAASAGGTGVVPVASAIADRWRELLHSGSSGLDVSAARHGLGSGARTHKSTRWPEWVAANRVTSNTRQSVSSS